MQNNLVSVVQNAQSASTRTRTYTYDGVGRLTTEVNPETNGATRPYSYTFDSDATCGTSQGDLVKRVDAVTARDIHAFPERLYQRTEGRWLTPDPAGLAVVDLTNPQSWNRYVYVLGNPLGLVDPTGLVAPCDNNTLHLGVDVGGSCFDGWASLTLMSSTFYYNGGLGAGGSAGGSSGSGTTTKPKPKPPTPARTGTLTQAATVMRCASDKANSVSLAALLPSNAPSFVKNIASNDFSTVSDLITGPGQRRDGALQSVQHGAGLNAVVYGVGSIATQTGFQLAQNGAGTYYVAGEVVTQEVASTATGKLAGAILGTVSEGKLIYDGATYAGSTVACLVGW